MAPVILVALQLVAPIRLSGQAVTATVAGDWDLSVRDPAVVAAAMVDIDRVVAARPLRYGLRVAGWVPSRSDSLLPPAVAAFVGARIRVTGPLYSRGGIGVLGRRNPGPGLEVSLAWMGELTLRFLTIQRVPLFLGLRTISDHRGRNLIGVVVAADLGS
jgi:hypothetical protein